MRFCLTAHLRQATTLLRRLEEAGQLWQEVEALVARERVPDRAIGALVSAGLLDAVGEKRARRYYATDRLRELRATVRRAPRSAPDDPFAHRPIDGRGQTPA